MRTVLICHEDDPANRIGLARWLASWSTLAGILVLAEQRDQKWRRVKREFKRSGVVGFADVVAYRFVHRLSWQRLDAEYLERLLADIDARFPPLPVDLPTLTTASPNSPEARRFLEGLRPDMAIARCKVILKPEIFEIPTIGTFVMHPGICPEYRNAHGCFWALAKGDLHKVGMTLLKVDRGIDTGPIYGHYTCRYDEARDSHITIQSRVVFDNLDAIRDKLLEVAENRATPIDVTGRPSGVWGQPRLSAYVAWRTSLRHRQGSPS